MLSVLLRTTALGVFELPPSPIKPVAPTRRGRTVAPHPHLDTRLQLAARYNSLILNPLIHDAKLYNTD